MRTVTEEESGFRMSGREPVQDLERVDAHTGEIPSQAIGRIQRDFQSASITFFRSAKGVARTTVVVRNCFAPQSVLRESLEARSALLRQNQLRVAQKFLEVILRIQFRR